MTIPPGEYAAIALDLGSTSIKAGLLGYDGLLCNVLSYPAPEIISDKGRYQSDALAYVQSAEHVLNQCRAQSDKIISLGLCSQRSSFLIWDAKTGIPLTPLISWQDTRGEASCEALRNQAAKIITLSGLRLTPYYLAPKLRVLLQEHPRWREYLASGDYLAGTLDTFLIWRWTVGKSYVTDVSMAARTLLMDIQQLQWSPELCDIFGIPFSILPKIIPSAGISIHLDNGLTLQASMGDQSAAFFASVGSSHKAALVNLGTGGFVLRDVVRQDGAIQNKQPEGYLSTLLYQDSAGLAHVALEGTLNSIAAALAAYPVDECLVADLAASDIFCVAEPSGLGAPYFRNDIGIRFSHSAGNLSPRQMATLLLEGIIFRVVRILEDFDADHPLDRIYLSGGLSEISCLQQGIAQCLPVNVFRQQQKDASLQGAALLAAGMSKVDTEMVPIAVSHNQTRLNEKYQHWKAWIDELLFQHAS